MAEQAPLYDPAVHTVQDDDPTVYVELYCTCGAIHRQRDPVSYVLPFLAGWHDRHAGDGHGEATKAACVTEREKRREAAHVVAGIAHEYQPKDHAHLQVDDEARPWPALPMVEES